MSEFKPTQEQETIKREFLEGKNLLVQAYAGCSKTTTQAYIAKAYSEAKGTRIKKLAVAFNVRAKQELAERLASYPDWDVKTFNGLGHGVLLANPRQFNGGRLTLNNNKIEHIMHDMFNRLHEQGRLLSLQEMRGMTKEALTHSLHEKIPGTDEMFDFLKTSVEACKTWGVKPGAYSYASMVETMVTEEDTIQTKFEGVENLGLMPESFLNRIVNNLLDVNLRQAMHEGIIDYSDQIYMSVLYCENKGRQWPVVLGDEVQDTSKLNVAQISRATTGQVCLVGDRYQRIYQFRGAYEGNMDDLQKIWDAKSLTLSKTFRCPVEVVYRSRFIIGVTDFESFNPSNQGVVQQPFVSRIHKERYTWDMRDIVRAHQSRRGANPQHRTVILCRRNKDCQAVLALLLATKQVAQGRFSLSDVGWSSNPLSLTREFLSSTIGNLISFAATASGINLSQALPHLKEPVLGEDSYHFVVSTVHRFKGLEADDVYLFNPDGLQGDTNVNYVAQTRSKRRLAFLHLDLLSVAGWDKGLIKAMAAVFVDWSGKTGKTADDIVKLWHTDKQVLLGQCLKVPKLDKKMKKRLLAARKQAVQAKSRSLGTVLALGPLRKWADSHTAIPKGVSAAPEPVKPPKSPEKQGETASDKIFFDNLLT